MRIEGNQEEGTWIGQAQMGDADAMQALLTMHYPLICALSARIHVSGIEKEALIQAGNMGLIQAVKRYRKSEAAKLITYAVPWILGEMKKAVRRETSSFLSLDMEAESGGKGIIHTICSGEGIDIGAVDLRMALEKLDEDLRMLICLRYFRDLTQKEAAQLLKKSQAQISRMERRALDSLHALLS